MRPVPEDYRRPLAQQIAGTMFDAYPVGSQPVDTSEDAADRVTLTVAKRRRLVLAYLESRGALGATADEICVAFHAESHNATSPRLTELVALGLAIRCDGKRGNPASRKRPTRTGSPAFVHVSLLAAQHLGRAR